jgi:hypothetical protein
MSPLKIGEQTPVSRLRDAKEAVSRAGAEYDQSKRMLDDYNATVRTLVQDAQIKARRAELHEERDRLFHVLQEKIQLASFYQSAMPPRRAEDWKRHERR